MNEFKENTLKIIVKERGVNEPFGKLCANYLSECAQLTLTTKFQQYLDSMVAQSEEEIINMDNAINTYKNDIEKLKLEPNMTMIEFNEKYKDLADIISFYHSFDIAQARNHKYSQANEVYITEYVHQVIDELLNNNEITKLTAEQLKNSYKENENTSIYSQLQKELELYKFTDGTIFSYAKIIDLAFTRYLNDIIINSSEFPKLIEEQGNKEYKDVYQKLYTTTYIKECAYTPIYKELVDVITLQVLRNKEIQNLEIMLKYAYSKKNIAEVKINCPTRYLASELGYWYYADKDITLEQRQKFNNEYGELETIESITEEDIINVMKKNNLNIPEKYAK